MMTVFEVVKNTREVKNLTDITNGVTLQQDSYFPEIIDSFDTLEEAETELSKYTSEIDELSGGNGKFYTVTEYYVQENTYDDDGEWRDGGDIWAFAPFKISIVSKSDYQTIGTFDNIEEALDAADNYANTYDDEWFISFN